MKQNNLKPAEPSDKILEWQDMELGVLIHWCMDIYNPDFKEIKSAAVRTEIPCSRINPTNLNPEQWVRSAYELGAKYAVLVANHCTGFSLWPTKENDYSVAGIAYRNGQCDVVKEFINACGKYGLKSGLYYSTGVNGWYDITDEIKQDYHSDKYRDYANHVEKQLTELWTEYGELFEIWFDGGVVPREYGGPDVYGLLEKYQPNAITFQGPTGWKNNIRWIGNENGSAPDNCWCAYDTTTGMEGSPKGLYYHPAESDFPNRNQKAFGGGWAWKKGEEKYVTPPSELFNCYLNTVGHNTNMLLGMAISTDGYFDDEDQFIEFGKILRNEFSNEMNFKPDYENGTYVISEFESSPKYIVIREDLHNGQSITGFNLYGDNELILSGNSIGHKRIIKPDISINSSIKFEITSSIDEYKIRDIKLYR